MVMDNGTNRTFATGATRDTAEEKLEYAGFLSPIVLRRFAAYMHKNRYLRDGSMRASDNWQKGIPLDVYEQSMARHFIDFWLHHRGWGYLAEEKDIQTVLSAIMFNVMGYMHELLKVEQGIPGALAGDKLVELLAETPEIALHDIPCDDSSAHKPHDSHVWEGAGGLYNCGGYPDGAGADLEGALQVAEDNFVPPYSPVWQSPPSPLWQLGAE